MRVIAVEPAPTQSLVAVLEPLGVGRWGFPWSHSVVCLSRSLDFYKIKLSCIPNQNLRQSQESYACLKIPLFDETVVVNFTYYAAFNWTVPFYVYQRFLGLSNAFINYVNASAEGRSNAGVFRVICHRKRCIRSKVMWLRELGTDRRVNIFSSQAESVNLRFALSIRMVQMINGHGCVPVKLKTRYISVVLRLNIHLRFTVGG